MIKSVFFKYILAFLSIITISFTILAAIISSNIMQRSIYSKQISMATAANIAKQSVEASFRNSSYDSFGEFIESAKKTLPSELSIYTQLSENSLILISDLEGKILITTPLKSNYLQKENVSDELMYDILNQREIDSFQTLDGVFFDNHRIAAQFMKNESGEFFGILFYCSSSVWETSYVNQIINTIILNCIWVLVASMVILYIITEKIISPVRAMSKTAKSFALGKFDARVPVKISHDEIGELASAFNNMAEKLAVNDETQRTFLANVSHDLRTPMQSIGGFVNSILDGTIPPEEHEHYLKIVSAETKRLSRLVSSLFNITRIQAGEKKINKKTFDICELARIVIILMEQNIEAKHLELEFECDEENIYVFADPENIHQVLQNLIENAIKFTPEKGLVKINISLSLKSLNLKDREKDKDKKVYISVYNTGTGIPAEDMPYIFDRFYKSDRSRGLDTTGAGLGLFFVKTIIDAHEEKIWVNSKYGQSCEFTFTLQKTHEAGVKYKF